uniref:Uncharacterized protein n=1 Tax=Sphenodon punctatus TaxID=8508 RepID=A0A8D0GRA2_SPHPU
MTALEMLLLRTPLWPPFHPLANYHYTGSDTWSPQEHQLFAEAFAQHGKDFARVQQMVRTKRLSQCVELYYLHKATLHPAGKRHPSLPGQGGSKGRASPVQFQPGPPCLPEGTIPGSFPCKQCGKMFHKVKSRNAHMKIHRQQEPPAPTLWVARQPIEPGLETVACPGLALPYLKGTEFFL